MVESVMVESTMLRLSLIVAAYNLGTRLERCLQSIAHQECDEFEVVVVDDGSDDDTYAVATAHAEANPHMQVVRHAKNRGLPAARNTGWRSAKGQYLWHIDGDDHLPTADSVAKVIATIGSSNLSAIKLAHWIDTGGKRRLVSHFKSQSVVKNTDLLIQAGGGGLFTHVYKRAFHESLGFYFVEGIDIGEDQLFVQMLARHVPAFANIADPLYVYDKSGPSMMRSPWSFDRFMRGRAYFRQSMRLFAYAPKVTEALTQQRVIHQHRLLLPKAALDLPAFEQQLFTYAAKEDLTIGQRSSENQAQSLPGLDEALFSQMFSGAEFVVHVGSHKTATTTTQDTLLRAREDLALQGVLYLDIANFRQHITLCSPTLAVGEIRKRLMALCAEHIMGPVRRVIISDENLVSGLRGSRLGGGRCLGCMADTHDISSLAQVLKALSGHPIKLICVVRDFADYLVSLHSEHARHFPYLPIDAYYDPSSMPIEVLSWQPLVGALRDLAPDCLHLLQFEDHADAPARLANVLSGFDLSDYQPPTQDPQIRRSRAVFEVHQAMALSQDKSPELFAKLEDFYPHGRPFRPFSEHTVRALAEHYTNDLRALRDMDHLDHRPLDVLLTEHPVQVIPPFRRLSGMTDLSHRLQSTHRERIKPPTPIHTRFLRSERITNREGFADFDCIFPAVTRPGVSAMIRIKNEVENMRPMLKSIATFFDEIIIVDNGSTDGTANEIDKIVEQSDSLRARVKRWSYPFAVAPCGEPHYRTPDNSVHSLVWYYNWSLSKCGCEYVWKWDADMHLRPSQQLAANALKSRVMAAQGSLLGRPAGVTVFEGHDDRCYYRPSDLKQCDELNSEIRLIPNIPSNRFIKDVLWERIPVADWQQVELSDGALFVEYKRCRRDEFSNWSSDTLSWGPRKIREFKDLGIVDRLSREPQSLARLREVGFEQWIGP